MAFPIDFAGRPCNTLTLPCEHVIRPAAACPLWLFSMRMRYSLHVAINGCNIILAYADDLVLLAPSWTTLQRNWLDKLQVTAGDIDMCCNSKKTVCMIFSPKCRSKTVAYLFPNFAINNKQFSFVNEFKYLGHIINNSQLDDADIYRERRNLFYRCNMLARRFYSCSVVVKLRLFKSFCVFMMRPYGTISLQAPLINLGQRMWNA